MLGITKTQLLSDLEKYGTVKELAAAYEVTTPCIYKHLSRAGIRLSESKEAFCISRVKPILRDYLSCREAAQEVGLTDAGLRAALRREGYSWAEYMKANGFELARHKPRIHNLPSKQARMGKMRQWRNGDFVKMMNRHNSIDDAANFYNVSVQFIESEIERREIDYSFADSEVMDSIERHKQSWMHKKWI